MLIDSACGKRPYASRAEAERVLRTIRAARRRRPAKKRSDFGGLRAYRCEDGCIDVWHLTSSTTPRTPRTHDDDPTDITVLPRGRRNVPVASLIPEDPQ
jgi:hypothetical protein